MTAPLLDVRGLRKFFEIRRGFRRRVMGSVRAVDDVSFTIEEGETLGLVGESGCGKTTTARCILRAMAPSSGEIRFRAADGRVVDLAPLSRAELRPLRPQIQMIFQDPFGSLNPRMTIFDNVGEPLLVNGLRSRRARQDRVAALLELTGLRTEYMHRFPHAFSGGQRQRIGIARALATEPRLVVADEPVSALDVSVRAQVLNLLLELRQRLGLTMLFVAHDLSVVKHICDRVAVMYVGRLVEEAPTAALFARPRHPYTAALIRAVPIPDPRAPSGRRPGRRGREPGQSAERLLLPSALPVRRRALPRGGAGAAGSGRPRRALSPRRGARSHGRLVSRVRNSPTREPPTCDGDGGVTGPPSVPRETTGGAKRWSKPGPTRGPTRSKPTETSGDPVTPPPVAGRRLARRRISETGH